MEKYKLKYIPVLHNLKAPHKNVLFVSLGMGGIGFGDLTGYWEGRVARMGWVKIANVDWKIGGNWYGWPHDTSIDMYKLSQFPQFVGAVIETRRCLKRWESARREKSW